MKKDRLKPNFKFVSKPQNSESQAFFIKKINALYSKNLPTNSSQSQKKLYSSVDKEVESMQNPAIHIRKVTRTHSIDSNLWKNPNFFSRELKINPKKSRQHKSTDFDALMSSTQDFAPSSSIQETYNKLCKTIEKSKSTPQKKIIFSRHTLQRSKLNTTLERNLHQEYIKDRSKFKLGNFSIAIKKSLWRPDCSKTLRKADRLLASLSRSKKHH